MRFSPHCFTLHRSVLSYLVLSHRILKRYTLKSRYFIKASIFSISSNTFFSFQFFSHLFHPDCSFPFLPSLSSLPKISPSVLFQKRTGLPGTLIKYGIKCYNKTSHILLHQGWIRQPSRRKGFHKQAKEPETTSAPTVRSPTRTPSYSVIL